nr:hypothetical protein [Tanacetum cinerariifolium]
IFKISECVEGKKVKFDVAKLEGPSLNWWKTKVATMGLETVNQMPWTKIKQLMTAEFSHKLMEKKSQARDARILEGKKQKWESLQGGNSSGKGNQKDNSRHNLHNSQKQGNARVMVTAPTNGKLPLCERCFTHHVGQLSKVILGIDVQRRLSKKKLEKLMVELMLLRMQSLKEFVDTRFSAMLDIDPMKIGASYEVELADERVASTNT